MITLKQLFMFVCSLSVVLSGVVSSSVVAADAPVSAPSLTAGIVAAVEGTQLTPTDIQAATVGVAEERLSVLREMPNARENLATDLLLRRAIAERARLAGADRDPLIAARLKIAAEKLLAELYLDKTEIAAIDEKKLESLARGEYRAFPERFRKEEVLVRHILVKTQRSCGRDAAEIIAELEKKLKAGESFEELAKQYSDDPASADRGGEIGWVVKGRTVPEFEDTVFAMKQPGSISPPVETKFGLHLIQMVERKPPVLMPFDEVKGALIEKLRNQQRQGLRNKLIAELNPPGAMRLDDAAISAALPPAPVSGTVTPPQNK